MPSDNAAAVIGDKQTDRSSSSEGRVDSATSVGMMLLYTGIALSMASLFWPSYTVQLLNQLITALHLPALMASSATATGGSYSDLAAALTQTLWVTGAVMLCVQPFKMRQWNFLVPGIGIVLASLLPLLGVGAVSAVVLRTAYTLLLMLWLGSLEGMDLCKAVLPWYWPRVWRGEMGPTALAIVGSEILGWGYSLFAVHAALGWVGLVAGSLVMMRFSSKSASGAKNIATAWYRLNGVYVVAGLIQLAWVAHS